MKVFYESSSEVPEWIGMLYLLLENGDTFPESMVGWRAVSEIGMHLDRYRTIGFGNYLPEGQWIDAGPCLVSFEVNVYVWAQGKDPGNVTAVHDKALFTRDLTKREEDGFSPITFSSRDIAGSIPTQKRYSSLEELGLLIGTYSYLATGIYGEVFHTYKPAFLGWNATECDL